MNIKGLIPNILPQDVKAIDRTGRAIQSDSAHDRDANGQESYSQQQQEHNKQMLPKFNIKALTHLTMISIRQLMMKRLMNTQFTMEIGMTQKMKIQQTMFHLMN